MNRVTPAEEDQPPAETADHLPTGAAGWFPDPWGEAEARYYDGAQWTGQIQRPLVRNPANSIDHWLIPIGRTSLSIVAGYVALFSVLLVPAPISLVLGIVALRQLKKRPDKLGKGRAIFAIVMGSVFSVVLVILLLLLPGDLTPDRSL